MRMELLSFHMLGHKGKTKLKTLKTFYELDA